MVDKNSSIKPIFKTLNETLTRATEIPFEAFSSIIGAPVTRILTPGSTEEERKARKEELFQKDKIRKDLMEGININETGGPTRVEEIQNINPGAVSPSRDQLLAMVGLEKDLKERGYPDVTFKGELDKIRESVFGPEYDVHKAVADGSLRLSEANGEQLTNYFFGMLTSADVLGLTSPVKILLKKAFDEKNISAMKNIASRLFPDNEAKNISTNVIGGMDKGKMVDQYGVTFQKDDGTGGGSSTTLKGTQNPKTREKIQKTNKDKQTAKLDKYDSALGLYYGGADNSITPTTMASDVGVKIPVIEEYAENNPNSFIAKYKTKKQVSAEEQVTEEVLDILRNAVESKGSKLNKLEAEKILEENNNKIPRTTITRILNKDPNSEFAQLVGARETGDSGVFNSYFPGFTRDSTVEARAQYTILRDIYRSGGFGNEKEFLEFMNEYGFVPNKIKRLDAEGKAVLNEKGKPIYDPNPEYNQADMRKKRENLFAYVKDEYFKEPGSYEEYLSKISHAKELTDYSIKKFVDSVMNNEGFRNQFRLQYKSKYPKRTASINDDVEAMAYDYASTHFNAQMAHVMPIGATKATTPVKGEQFKKAKNLEGQMFQSAFLNVNYAAHNIGTQRQYENIIRKIVADIKNGNDVQKNLDKLVSVNESMTERGLQTYLRFSDKQMPDNVFKMLQAKVGNKAQVEPEQAGVKSLFIGDKANTLEENIAFFDMRMDGYINNPSSFKISNARPKSGDASSDEMFIKGDAPYIGEGKPTNFDKGGDAETEQENQSFLSKAASTISDILIPKAEALPLPKNFLLGDVPKIFKKPETPKQIAPPTEQLFEKRYNIMDEAGNKVFQSKSLPDAEQKALQLGEAEGKPFVVQEVEVPIKQKKKNLTTKPGTSLVPTVTPESIIGVGNNKLFYSDLNSIINTETGNLTIKGITAPAESTSMSAKEWHDWFRSSGVKEGELYDSYVRSYLNKKGGFNRETGQFTNDQKIPYAEIKELVDTSPTNYLQTVSYSDEAGTLKYGNSGRQDNYIGGTRKERVLWLDSNDIRGDSGSLPPEIARYEGHGNMRNVQSSADFSVQSNTLGGEPYVIGWSLSSNRIGKLNNRNITVNVADEIQSDFLQKAASLKSNIKQEIRRFINQSENQQIGRNEGLEILYKRLENVFRPMPATYAELKKALDKLQRSSDIFQGIASMNLDDMTKATFQSLGEASAMRDEALQTINQSIDNIDVRELFPNIPFKDQKDWVDAIIKNDIYHAAKARFSFDESGKLVVNNEAPSHYAVAPAKAVKAYSGGRGVELPPNSPDRDGRMVAYDMQYGGPNLNDHTGQHFTSNTEETLKKIANMKNSKLEVGKVDFGFAGEEVDTFMIELTPDMLLPYKAYKKDGGLVKKSVLYTPIVSVDKLLSPIGASRW